jgi:hypothetical protein
MSFYIFRVTRFQGKNTGQEYGQDSDQGTPSYTKEENFDRHR